MMRAYKVQTEKLTLYIKQNRTKTLDMFSAICADLWCYWC